MEKGKEKKKIDHEQFCTGWVEHLLIHKWVISTVILTKVRWDSFFGLIIKSNKIVKKKKQRTFILMNI